MDELTLLANALMALDDKLAACMKCGMCQSVCPVFGETMMEADVTRGKLTLLEKLAHRLIEDPDAVNEKLNRCLLCGSCQANCPSGVSILEIFMEARAIVAAIGGLLESDPDGTPVARWRHPVSVPDYATATPDHVLLDGDLFA